MDLLEVRSISKTYGSGETSVRALKKVNFSVQKGEYVAIVGESGSGKSTLLNMIGALDNPTSGKVLIDGKDIFAMKESKLTIFRRRNIGFIFQNYNLVYSLSVLQNVLHGRLGYMGGVKGVFGRYSEEDKQEALDLLKELGLEEFSYNRSSDLSGGQKQRVGIARAIMQRPKLLLCDEPIASLDPSSAKTIMDLLKTMTQKRNIACIVNLHQLDVALKYSTRIIGLSKGEIVFDGRPEELDDATIEQIYGTSRKNLMIGGERNDQKNSAHCA